MNLAVWGGVVALLIARGAGAGGVEQDGDWTWQEIALLVGSFLAFVLLAGALWYLLPPVEFLAPGQATRLRRFGPWLLSVLVIPVALWGLALWFGG